MRYKRSGFTIVELLIVIVVIAILSAISVVAYGGIQDRAKSDALLSAFDSIEKGLRAYASIHGEYPVPSDITSVGGNQLSYACLQPTNGGWPTRDGMDPSECLTINGSQIGYAGYSDAVNQALLTIMSKIPDTSSYTIGGGSVAYRGILYEYEANPTGQDVPHVRLAYHAVGDQVCGRGEKFTVGQFTLCTLKLQ